jgi:hypothetical protein
MIILIKINLINKTLIIKLVNRKNNCMKLWAINKFNPNLVITCNYLIYIIFNYI